MLKLEGVNTYYGAIHAVKNLTLEVGEGEIVTLIGANGAGKTTTLKTISGLLRPRTGKITFKGKDITTLPPDKIVRAGICHAPEGRRIFSNLTVRENLELGAYTLRNTNAARATMEMVLDRFPRLRERLNQYGGTLSGGEQQMLAIGRALMARPSLLLLDEPSLGLAPFLVQEIFNIIGHINKEEKTAILLVEQNAHMALGAASRGYVIETGRIIMSDAASNLINNDDVKKAYLGE